MRLGKRSAPDAGRKRRILPLPLAMVVLALIVLTPQHAQAWWNDWGQIPGGWHSYSGPAAAGNEVFIRGIDDHIYRNRRTSSGWTGWSEVPGNGTTYDAPAAVKTPQGLFLIVRGTDDYIYRNHRDLNGNWSGWYWVPGDQGGVRPYTSLAAVWNSFYTRLEVYANLRSRIYMTAWDPDAGGWWGDWDEVPGNGITYSAPTVAAGGDYIRLFVRGNDDRIWQNWKHPSGSFKTDGYEALPDGLTYSSPAAAMDSIGNTWVTVRGTDDRVYSSRGGWHPVGNGRTYLQPGMARTDSFGTCVFVSGTDYKLYYNCE